MIINQIFSAKQTSCSTVSSSEKPLRSLVKSISWRIIGTFDTIIISWIITGTLVLALSIGMIELITKMVLYFFHERIWNGVRWGK